MANNRIFWYHLIAILTVTIWGTTFVATKVLISHGLTPAGIFCYRFTLAYACIWFISPKILFARSLKDELLLIAAGLSGGSLYFIAENTALGITLASNVSLIICTTPILAAFLSFLLFRKEKLKHNLIYGSVIALAGVILVVFNGSFLLKISPIGDMLTLAAALMWAFYCLILKQLDTRYPTIFITRKVFFYGVLTILPFFSIQPQEMFPAQLLQPVVIFNLLFLGIIASMLCYIMWNTAVKELGALRVSNYIYIIPLVTLLTSRIVIHESITLIALTGSILILCGVYLAEKGFHFANRVQSPVRKSGTPS